MRLLLGGRWRGRGEGEVGEGMKGGEMGPGDVVMTREWEVSDA